MSSAGRLAQAIDGAALLARRELRQVMAGLQGKGPGEVKAALLDAVPAITAKYGNVAALAAARHYAREREAMGLGPFEALLAPPVEREAVRAKVRYALGHVYGGSHGR